MKMETKMLLAIMFIIILLGVVVWTGIKLRNYASKENTSQPLVINQIVMDTTNYVLALSHIKYYETLRLLPYELNGKYYIGYGHQINHSNQYLMNGISKEYAETLLNRKIQDLILYFADKYNIKEPNQLLALALLGYNIGIGAVNGILGEQLKKLNNTVEYDPEVVLLLLKRKWLSICHYQGKKHPQLQQRRVFEFELYVSNMLISQQCDYDLKMIK